MTLTDIRRHVLESTNVEWLNNIEVTFDFHYVEDSFTLKGLSTIYEFITKQVNGWEKLGDSLPSQLLNSKNYFQNIRNQIDHFVANYI